MSGKYAKKKNNRGGMVALILILAALAVAVTVALMNRDGGEVSPDGTDPVSTTAPTEAQQQTDSTEPTETPTELPKPEGIDLGKGLIITDIGGYSGAYVEDGSNEEVSNVLMIEVYNYGVSPVQYAEISLNAGDQTANFAMTTLPVGESIVILESSRMAFDKNAAYAQAEARNVADFNTPMSLCQDKIQIQALDGAMNIINVSGKDIDGEVAVYYKNVIDGQLFGGITFRVRLTDGMKADEVRQILASHFSASDSRVMFVTCG